MSRLIFNSGGTPSVPAAGKVIVYSDSSDKRVKMIDEIGVVSSLSETITRHNYIINGAFTFAQRQDPATLTGYSTATGRLFGADRWGTTVENSGVQFKRTDTSTAPEVGLHDRYYGKFKKSNSPGKIIISQVVEALNAMPLRGRAVRFQVLMKYSVASSMTVRLGLLQLTSAGTTNTIPATFVSAVNAVGTDPTFGTNLTLIAPTLADGGTIVGSALTCVLTNAWVRYSATFTVPSDCLNLIPVIFTNGQPATNDELNITEAGLYQGQEIIDWSPRTAQAEQANCQRFYAKTFRVDDIPQQNAGVSSGALRSFLSKAGALAVAAQFQWRFPVPMRGTPTMVTYNPAVANAQVRQVGGTAADLTATAAGNTTSESVDITATGAATGVVGDQIEVHVSADAEL